MNVFRLVLCFAGLAAYLIAKQTLPYSEAIMFAKTTVSRFRTIRKQATHGARDLVSTCEASGGSHGFQPRKPPNTRSQAIAFVLQRTI